MFALGSMLIFNTRDMLDLHRMEAYTETLETAILSISILRIVQSMSLHPRMALISGTIARAPPSPIPTISLQAL